MTFTPTEARARFPGHRVDCLCGARLTVVAYIVANGSRHYRLRCLTCQRLSRRCRSASWTTPVVGRRRRQSAAPAPRSPASTTKTLQAPPASKRTTGRREACSATTTPGRRRNCARPAMRSGMRSCAGRRGYDNSARSRARLRCVLRRFSVHREEDADQDRGPLRAWLCQRDDAAVITKTWTQFKAADIGLALPRGVLVADVDVAKGKKGRDDFIRLFGCGPEEMATAVSTTVRGGWHVYFSSTSPSSSCSARSPRASIPASAAWATSSRLPGNGRRWIRPLLSTPLMEATQWLLERLRRPSRPRGEHEAFRRRGERGRRRHWKGPVGRSPPRRLGPATPRSARSSIASAAWRERASSSP